MMIFDLHNDVITSGLSFDEILEQESNCGKNDVSVIYAIWTSRLNFEELLDRLTFASKNQLNFGIEDCGIIADKPEILSKFRPLYCSLTWNGENSLAGGAHSTANLTSKGRAFVEKLNESGIALDLAHLNEQSFWQAIELADKPIITHTCFSRFCSHPRNVTENQIRAVVNKCGIVGLTFVPAFLREASITGVTEQILWFIDNFGSENLAIGTDFFGSDSVSGLEDYSRISAYRKYLINNSILTEDQCNNIFYNNALKFFNDIKRNLGR